VDELLQLQPTLSHVALNAHLSDASEGGSDHEQRFRLILRRYGAKAQQSEKRSKAPSNLLSATEGVLQYDVKGIDSITQRDILAPTPGGQILGAEVRHFLPFRIGVQFDRAKRQARRIAAIMSNAIPAQYRDRELLDIPIPLPVLQLLRNHPVLNGIFPQPNLFGGDAAAKIPLHSLLENIRQAQRALSVTLRRTFRRELVAIRLQIENSLSSTLPSRMDVSLVQSEHIIDLVEYSRAYFVSAVRYLGPLRDEPKPVYPLEALANPTEVGYKGEHTAAVLDLHRDQPIDYIPSSFVDSPTLDRSLKRVTLHDAVVDWLSYVGVAEEVKTDDQGKLGHQLQVQTKGLARLHDLTNVGVGVSQVLPIIVMTLLAESPSLLIFEQPELHLHPKVQARLADFFLSAALLGKQCLLETHSEYLVERFRRRIAEAPDDSLIDTLKVYFTERKEGKTTCRPVNISRFGAITDYPDEFFDQSQLETEGILQAARAKRVAERNAAER
jgi:predicted ATPase